MLLPRRTAHKTELWRKLFARFDRFVVHSESGRGTLAALGVAEEKLRVIPHPVFPSDPPRADDGRTLLCLGVIRPYKGLQDAIEATKRIRAHEAATGGHHTPILALTANTLVEDRYACFEAGMNGFLIKPLDREKLDEALAGLAAARHLAV